MDYIIDTPCGKVRGTKTNTEGIIAYKGIRYASAGRFEYPTEVTSWDGIYDATEYGACAYQPRSFYNEEDMPKKIFYYNEFRKGESYKYSEDCLFLNVFTPEKTQEKMPVIVYIHGGGFTGGCGHEKHFDTPIWPKKGVIGVTINYRLGPLGFLVLPELKEKGHMGNYGLYDQYTALLWVKHNISAFGGDENNITIMGQSAGGMSVQQHCLSPLSQPLFHKAVMSSGGGVNKILSTKEPSENNYAFWKAVMAKTGAETLEEFKMVEPKAIFKAWDELRKSMKGGFCTPFIDGRLIVGSGANLLEEKKHHKIPYMIGSTSHDMMPPFLYSMAKKWVKAQELPSYLWYFERNLPGDNHGAWHSSDLWYWFGTLKNGWRPFTERDYAISEQMTDYLTSFAKNAVPVSENGIEWQSGHQKAVCFGDKESKMGNPNTLKLWWTMFTNEAPGE